MPITADVLKSNFGFNDPNVISNILKDPSQVASYERQYSQMGGGGAGVMDYNSYLKQQQEAQRAAIQPAIASLQEGLPVIAKNYATKISQKQAEIAPLTERYKNLISEIKGLGQTSANRQTAITAGELGKRGIEGSSTLAQQEIANAVSPIEQQTQGQVKEAGLAQESDIKAINDAISNLEGEQTDKELAIKQAIANLNAGAGQTAASNALGLFQSAIATAAKAKEPVKKDIIELGNSKYLVDTTTGAKTYLGPSSSGGSGNIIIGGLNEGKPTTPPKQTISNDVPGYATPVKTSNVLGQDVIDLGPENLIKQTAQVSKNQPSWWDLLFGVPQNNGGYLDLGNSNLKLK